MTQSQRHGLTLLPSPALCTTLLGGVAHGASADTLPNPVMQRGCRSSIHRIVRFHFSILACVHTTATSEFPGFRVRGTARHGIFCEIFGMDLHIRVCYMSSRIHLWPLTVLMVQCIHHQDTYLVQSFQQNLGPISRYFVEKISGRQSRTPWPTRKRVTHERFGDYLLRRYDHPL